MALLNNEEIENLATQATDQASALEDLFYTQYKSAYVLTETTSFKGAAADSYKQYIQLSTIHHINMFMNILEEIKTAINEIKEIYLGYESDSSGKVATDDLETAEQSVAREQRNVSTITSRVETLNTQAAEYIPVTDIESNTLDTDFQAVLVFLTDTVYELSETDDTALATAETIYERIQDLTNSINNISENYYDSQGAIVLDRVGNIRNEPWYETEPTTAIDNKLVEDPFFYAADSQAVGAEQWAAGLATDTYAAAGYEFLNYNYQTGIDNGVYSATGETSVFEGNANAEFGGIAKAEVAGRGVYGNGTAEFGSLIGESDKRGIHLDGEVGVADIQGEARLGNDLINAEATAGAQGLTAEGTGSLMYEDQNNYAVGLKGEATAVDVSASAGVSFFDIDVKGEHQNGQKIKERVSLFGVDVEASAGVSAEVAAYVETQNVAEFGPLNLNATSLEIGGKFGLGLKLNVNVPTVTFDFPW
ncbi:hypothetical protein JTF06_07740 [Desemzia sp. RIT804]|uniref:T7SS effector LXG polymorphic toxin n=1 Tax=Desemzia sp. RIT 804 TaxID=2810209 RepID=UPI00194FF4D8|nr:T7SS effector LXG polymorphic toxin [Desemzia sp. RIT 804]MBM6614782.1 hypothetical protein [Desemzia sp. RIT 804]